MIDSTEIECSKTLSVNGIDDEVRAVVGKHSISYLPGSISNKIRRRLSLR